MMGDSATAKQAEADVLKKLDDQTGKLSDDEAECSPTPKKRRLGFGKKVKDTKKANSIGKKGAKRKNTKQPAQKSKSKSNTFSEDLGSPARVASVLAQGHLPLPVLLIITYHLLPIHKTCCARLYERM